jgi:hypothetical protein
MLTLVSIVALIVATSPSAIVSPSSLLAPGGVGCEGDTHLTLEIDPDGRPYMSGFGKMICTQVGPGEVTAVLHKNGEEVARKKVETLDTNAIAAVTVPCSNGPEEVSWLLAAQYSDDWIGMSIQHRFVDNQCG